MKEPDDPRAAAAFDDLRDDASGVDAMTALHRFEGRERRNVRLAVLGSLAAAVLVVFGVRMWVGPSERALTTFTGTSSETLYGTSWVLVSGSGPEGEISPVEGAPITLTFDESSVSGNGGCNDYGAFFEFEDGLRFGTTDLYWNASGCEGPVNNAEAAFFAALRDANALSFAVDELTLTGTSSMLTFRAAPPETERSVLSSADLNGTAWVLVNGGGPDGEVPIIDGWPITLAFAGDTLGGVGPCNDYGARFEVARTNITLDELSSNDVGCGDLVNASEAAFFAVLETIEAINLDSDELVLFGEEVQLVFRPDAQVPTDELVGRLWLLTGLIQGDTTSRPIGQPATLRLNADGSLEGSTGCRTLAGSYTIFGSSVNFTAFGAEGDCLGSALAEQDGLVVTVLGDGFTAEINGEELNLTSEGNEGLQYFSIEGAPEPPALDELTMADLAGTRWTFTEGIASDTEILPVDGYPITLRIALDAILGNSSCGDYSAPLAPGADGLLADNVEATAEDCDDPAATDVDTAYLQALSGITTFSVSDDFLALHGPSVELNFQNDSTLTPSSDPSAAEVILRADGLGVEGGPAPGVYEFHTDAEALGSALVEAYGAPVRNEPPLSCNRIDSQLHYENAGLVVDLRRDTIGRETIIGWSLLGDSELKTATGIGLGSTRAELNDARGRQDGEGELALRLDGSGDASKVISLSAGETC